jgi:hypothetical protein
MKIKMKNLPSANDMQESVLVVLVFALASLVDGQISSYGNYCGTGNKQTDGRIPIDDLDRNCQIHDICVDARGELDCHCNTQLYCAINAYPSNASQAYLDERDELIAAMEAATSECPLSCSDIDGMYTVAVSTSYGYNYIPFFDPTCQRITALGPGMRFYYTLRTDNLTEEIPERIESAKILMPYDMLCSCHPHQVLVVVSTIPLYGHSNYVDIGGMRCCVYEVAENGTIIERYWPGYRNCMDISSASSLEYTLILSLLALALLL